MDRNMFDTSYLKWFQHMSFLFSSLFQIDF